MHGYSVPHGLLLYMPMLRSITPSHKLAHMLQPQETALLVVAGPGSAYLLLFRLS